MGKLYTMGEALIDMFEDKDHKFQPMVGGAPANVAGHASLLGTDTYFIGMVGADMFGHMIKDTLEDCGVQLDFCFQTERAHTSLAFVRIGARGERTFTFYREPGADTLLEDYMLDDIFFEQDDILHFGSVALSDSPTKVSHLAMIQKMMEAGGLISFDVNVRTMLWDNLDQYRETILSFLRFADIVKVSEEDLGFISQGDIQSLFVGQVKWIILTKGKEGASLYTKDLKVEVSGEDVDSIDATGAGDAFVGTFLHHFIQNNQPIDAYDEDEMKLLLDKANQAAALSTTKLGALPSNIDRD